jgi:hypothetical protein
MSAVAHHLHLGSALAIERLWAARSHARVSAGIRTSQGVDFAFAGPEGSCGRRRLKSRSNCDHAMRVVPAGGRRMTIQARTLYTSANGDVWSLCRNRKGEVVVSHRPNPPSVREPSEIDLGTFLAKGNQRPEHQALRQLIDELIESSSVPAEYDDHD